MGLFSERVPTAKFNQIGDKVGGAIVRFETQQRTEYVAGQKGAGRPMFWVGGKPTAGIAADPQTGEPNQPVTDRVIVLDTEMADEYGETLRRLFVKSKQMLNDIREACKKAGVRDVDEGGWLTCTWVSGAGRSGDPKVYAFEYAPPAAVPGQPASLVGPVTVSSPAQQSTEHQREAVRHLAGVGARNAEKREGALAATTTKQALGIRDDEEPPF